MTTDPSALIDVLCQTAPFDQIPSAERMDLAPLLIRVERAPGNTVFETGEDLQGLYLIEDGMVEVRTDEGDLISYRSQGEIMGERGLLRDGRALLSVIAVEPTQLIILPAERFHTLFRDVPAIAQWFARAVPARDTSDSSRYATGLTALLVKDLMSRKVTTCPPGTSVTEAARLMRDNRISAVLVTEEKVLSGIITVHDLANKVLAEGLDGNRPVSSVMTPDPIAVSPSATGLDALMLLSERRINQLPVQTAKGRLRGIISKSDLIRQQASTASNMVSEIASADSAAEMHEIMQRLPELLAHLVAASAKPQAITRRITDLTDAITRRLLFLAEERIGPPPVPYVWAACGSQGRREQTGVSDQDNCLIIDDAMTPEDDAYFAELARLVSDGLNNTGFVYCPGDMMATNPRWRQPRRVWQRYFNDWIAQPDTEAQMLASVMFDLRPIKGAPDLFDDLHRSTLEMARKNSIFVAHMVSNSLKHAPPLTLFRSFALIRGGAHKNKIDLKMSGIVPIVDLGRIYALRGAIEEVNTRDRLQRAGEAGVISASGARDLLDAYDLIAEIRLRHQAARIAEGHAPDNYLAPDMLSELERNHLRDAFLVVKTMQSAAGQGRGVMG
ncbi:putative nucleotidyltransferase substrate binding domain-containing protein [Palleronia caenipelagi]|uniref:CBS domain-containing protein n=1 Tax=Palleronia caenipelagi TaxID=2489174 RepID=A0A547PMZ5_9RHOB|nr:putative nucleotidyltransferase substrate binding domain-containing protein [Palleronia caenipelagi]TRD15394.1 CBS domain-containing protein [Palleronia caenipelagi]